MLAIACYCLQVNSSLKEEKGHSMSTHTPLLPTISDFSEIWHVCRFGRENVSHQISSF